MSRRPRVLESVLAVSLLASACKVEQTPPEYFDHRDRIATERDASRDELEDRLLALGQALSRGNATEAMIALAPAPDATVLTPVDGEVLTGAEQIGAALQRFAGVPVAVRMRDVRVEVGPLANAAWFAATLDVPGRAPEGTQLQITGVYLRREGAWQLVQAHVSTATPPPSPQPQSQDGDAGSPEGE